MNGNYRHERVLTNDVELHVIQAGPTEGPLVILLHGFPEFWYGWRHQIDFLAEAGYRVWVPDQRGYNLSDKPKKIKDYNLDELAADVIGLIDAANCEKAVIVGHDWGAGVAWWTASKYPERLEKMVILNVPHHSVMAKTIQKSVRQMMKSWYMFFFQLPKLPELTIRAGNWHRGVSAIQNTARQGTFSDEEMDRYREAWSQPGAMTGMINWYRALFRHRPKPLRRSRVTVPTLLIWGVKDAFLEREMAQPSIDRCDDGQLIFIEEASHWVQHEEAEKVNSAIKQFLNRSVT